jgi:hypothetical protein
MLTEAELTEQLRQLSRSEFAPKPDADVVTLVEAMTWHIGSANAELRDELIYSAFATWILQDIFTPTQLRELLSTALDDQHIFYRIGESHTDSVFSRSFSMLLLPLILIAHRQRPFLTRKEIVTLKQKVLRYIALERDYRGFVEGKGWAHAVAHTADALDDLARCVELDAADLMDILKAIQMFAGTAGQVFTHEEDERLSVAVGAVLERQVLEAAVWENWLESCVAVVQEPKPLLQSRYCQTNMKNFLRSVYFRIGRLSESGQLDQAITTELTAIIGTTINQLTRF